MKSLLFSIIFVLFFVVNAQTSVDEKDKSSKVETKESEKIFKNRISMPGYHGIFGLRYERAIDDKISVTVEPGVQIWGFADKVYIGAGVFYYPYGKAISGNGINLGASIGYNHVFSHTPITRIYSAVAGTDIYNIQKKYYDRTDHYLSLNKFSLTLSARYNWVFKNGYSMGISIGPMIYYTDKIGFWPSMQFELISFAF